MTFLCWLLGHRWATYTVGTAAGYAPEVWLNDRCLRCDEYRNPLIEVEQRRVMRSGPGSVETGEWCKAKGHDVAPAIAKEARR